MLWARFNSWCHLKKARLLADTFFPVRSCAMETWGSYDWPVNSINCLLCILTSKCMLAHAFAFVPKAEKKCFKMIKNILFSSCVQEAHVRLTYKYKAFFIVFLIIFYHFWLVEIYNTCLNKYTQTIWSHYLNKLQTVTLAGFENPCKQQPHGKYNHLLLFKQKKIQPLHNCLITV